MFKKIFLFASCASLSIIAMEEKSYRYGSEQPRTLSELLRSDSRRGGDQTLSVSIAAHNDRMRTLKNLQSLTQVSVQHGGSKTTTSLAEHITAFESAKIGNLTLCALPSELVVRAIVNQHMQKVSALNYSQIVANNFFLKTQLSRLEQQYAIVKEAHNKTEEQLASKRAEITAQVKEEFSKYSSIIPGQEEQKIRSLMEKHYSTLIREHKLNEGKLDQLQAYMQICKECIAYNEKLLQKERTNEIEKYSATCKELSNSSLQQEVSFLKTAITNKNVEIARDNGAINDAMGILEKAKAESKTVILLSGIEKSLEAYGRDIKTYVAKVAVKEQAVTLLQSKLDCVNKELAQRITNLKEYAEIKEVLAKNDKQKLSILDLTILNAVEKTVAENGKFQYKNPVLLSKQESETLKAFNISLEEFWLKNGDRAQIAFYEAIRDTIKIVSDTYARNKENHEIKEYAQATLNACAHAAETIKLGTPKQTVSAINLAYGLKTALAVMAGFDEGLQKGTIFNTAHFVASRLVPHYFAASLIYSVGHAIVNKPNVAEAWHKINELPLDKQVAMITEMVSTFICQPSGLNNLINNIKVAQCIENLIKKEAQALQALVKVESTTLITIKGITVSEKIADRIKPLIESGQLAKQTDVEQYLQRIKAPFITSFKEAIEDVAQKLGKVANVEQKIASETKALAEKATKVELPSNATTQSQQNSINQGHEAILKDGYYEVNGFKFSEFYYNRLWDKGREAPSLIAKAVLEHAKEIIPDPKGHEGFFKYTSDGWEMVYSPSEKIVSHLAPLKKNL